MTKECKQCGNYGDCHGKEWYSIADIRWCPFQVVWIITEVNDYNWPQDPNGSGYIDIPIGTKRIITGAHFTNPVEVVAELEYRLKRTGLGDKLVAELRGGTLIEELSPEVKQALMYIRGWRRKRMSYPAWKKQRAYRSRNE